MDRKIAAVFAAVMLMTVSASAAPGASAKAAVLMDMESGRVLYEQNADEMLPIASTTKILTALVVLENCDPNEAVRITAQAAGTEGSSMYLKSGEVLTVKELLYGLLLRSGNDAAMALAIHCGGTTEDFCRMMNEKAQELGLENCCFLNPSGLPQEGHLCSAGDLAVIARAAMENPDFARIVATESITIGNRYLVNHNKLLRLYPGANGVKTGFTKAAGRTLVGSASRNGQTLIAVTLNDPEDWQDHINLFDWGFDTCPLKLLVAEGQPIAELPGWQGDSISVAAGESFSYPLFDGEKPDYTVYLPGFVWNTPMKGDILGRIDITLKGQLIGSVTLAAE